MSLYLSLCLSSPSLFLSLCLSLPVCFRELFCWFISFSISSGVFLALFFAIRSIFHVFCNIFSSSNQLAYFFIFISKFFVSVCNKFYSFFLTAFLIFPQNIHDSGNIQYSIGFICNYFHNNLRLFDVLPNFIFISRETCYS